MSLPAERAGRRVLVVEDQADVRESLCMLLSLCGHEVRSAADGPGGLELALSWRPDAVVSDVGMPGLDGWDLARQLRLALGGSVVLVALTAYAGDDDRERSREAGFDHHLAKPAEG